MTTGDMHEHKADFSRIYTSSDPREYFAALAPLDYQIPQHALPVVEAVLAAAGPERTVLDVCCSYGINAALLRTSLDLAALAARHTGTSAGTDRDFYAAHRRPGPRVLGLDASAPAVAYGLETGLLDAGWAEDLEAADPSPALAAGLRDVGVVVCTGGVGYIGTGTFARLLAAVERPGNLWLAVFVLRVFDYDDIAAMLDTHGLVTERLPGTFPQRRFADRAEADAACRDVERRGLDPTGREAAGWYHAECWLSRPVGAPPLRS